MWRWGGGVGWRVRVWRWGGLVEEWARRRVKVCVKVGDAFGQGRVCTRASLGGLLACPEALAPLGLAC